MLPYVGTLLKARIRLAISIICTVLFFVVAVSGIISHILFDGQDPRKWYPSDGGWIYHVISSISEWLIATVFCFYILSFTDEFRDIHIDHPHIRIIEWNEIDYTYTTSVEETVTVPCEDNENILS